MIGGIAGGPKHGVIVMSFGEEPVPSVNWRTGALRPGFVVFTTPSVKSAYMTSGMPGPVHVNSRLNAPLGEAEIVTAFGVFPVSATPEMKIGPLRNCRPGVM